MADKDRKTKVPTMLRMGRPKLKFEWWEEYKRDMSEDEWKDELKTLKWLSHRLNKELEEKLARLSSPENRARTLAVLEKGLRTHKEAEAIVVAKLVALLEAGGVSKAFLAQVDALAEPKKDGRKQEKGERHNPDIWLPASVFDRIKALLPEFDARWRRGGNQRTNLRKDALKFAALYFSLHPNLPVPSKLKRPRASTATSSIDHYYRRDKSRRLF
jgi:hypothetical protein